MRIRVLVVDDDPVVCESLSIMLSDCGYAAVTADSGRNALAQIENSQFDLVLSERSHDASVQDLSTGQGNIRQRQLQGTYGRADVTRVAFGT